MIEQIILLCIAASITTVITTALPVMQEAKRLKSSHKFITSSKLAITLWVVIYTILFPGAIALIINDNFNSKMKESLLKSLTEKVKNA